MVKQKSVMEKVDLSGGCEKQKVAKQGPVSLSAPVPVVGQASHSRHRPRAGRMRKELGFRSPRTFQSRTQRS